MLPAGSAWRGAEGLGAALTVLTEAGFGAGFGAAGFGAAGAGAGAAGFGAGLGAGLGAASLMVPAEAAGFGAGLGAGAGVGLGAAFGRGAGELGILAATSGLARAPPKAAMPAPPATAMATSGVKEEVSVCGGGGDRALRASEVGQVQPCLEEEWRRTARAVDDRLVQLKPNTVWSEGDSDKGAREAARWREIETHPALHRAGLDHSLRGLRDGSIGPVR